MNHFAKTYLPWLMATTTGTALIGIGIASIFQHRTTTTQAETIALLKEDLESEKFKSQIAQQIATAQQEIEKQTQQPLTDALKALQRQNETLQKLSDSLKNAIGIIDAQNEKLGIWEQTFHHVRAIENGASYVFRDSDNSVVKIGLTRDPFTGEAVFFETRFSPQDVRELRIMLANYAGDPAQQSVVASEFTLRHLRYLGGEEMQKRYGDCVGEILRNVRDTAPFHGTNWLTEQDFNDALVSEPPFVPAIDLDTPISVNDKKSNLFDAPLVVAITQLRGQRQRV